MQTALRNGNGEGSGESLSYANHRVLFYLRREVPGGASPEGADFVTAEWCPGSAGRFQMVPRAHWSSTPLGVSQERDTRASERFGWALTRYAGGKPAQETNTERFGQKGNASREVNLPTWVFWESREVIPNLREAAIYQQTFWGLLDSLKILRYCTCHGRIMKIPNSNRNSVNSLNEST